MAGPVRFSKKTKRPADPGIQEQGQLGILQHFSDRRRRPRIITLDPPDGPVDDHQCRLAHHLALLPRPLLDGGGVGDDEGGGLLREVDGGPRGQANPAAAALNKEGEGEGYVRYCDDDTLAASASALMCGQPESVPRPAE